VPPAQRSPLVQASPSSQALVVFVWTHTPPEHESVVQTF
jgi:hypothetical protein